MNDDQIEQEIQEKDLTAPRLTPQMIEDIIVNEDYHNFNGTTFIVCCLTLVNGFMVIGESRCTSLENFDKDLSKKIASDNAKQKIWVLEGYALYKRLKK